MGIKDKSYDEKEVFDYFMRSDCRVISHSLLRLEFSDCIIFRCDFKLQTKTIEMGILSLKLHVLTNCKQSVSTYR